MIINEITAKEAIVKSKLPSADYVVNSYTGCTHKCIYCYAEFMKRFSNHSENWGEFIDIKTFDKIRIPKNIENKYVFISSVTDPYNHFEKKYERTKQVLEILINTDCNIGILTKSDLVLRDLDIFKCFRNIEVGISINTTDDNFRKIIEPKAAGIVERINILKILKENKIKNYLFMSPIFPFLSDYKDIIEKTGNFVDYYCFENLNLRAGYKHRVLNMIKNNYPDLMKRYVDIFENNNLIYWQNLEKEIKCYCKENKIKYKLYFYHDKIKKK